MLIEEQNGMLVLTNIIYCCEPDFSNVTSLEGAMCDRDHRKKLEEVCQSKII